MALNVRDGDELVYAREVMPIYGVERLPLDAAGGILEMMTATCATRRAPEMTNGKRGDAAEYLTDVQCTPLMPVIPTIELRPTARTPVKLFEVYLDGDTEVIHVLVERTNVLKSDG